MLDLLAAIFIDAAGLVSHKTKEDTRRALADARRRDQHQQERYRAMAAQIDCLAESTMADTDRVLTGLDPLYPQRLNHYRRSHGLPPVAA
jgi:hypothetical protein